MHRLLAVTMTLGLAPAVWLSPTVGAPARAASERPAVRLDSESGTVRGMPVEPHGHASDVAVRGAPDDGFGAEAADPILGDRRGGWDVHGAKRWVFVERLTVPADSVSGITSTAVLDPSGQYAFRAFGTWVNQVADFLVDAEFSIVEGIVRDGHPPDPEALDANWGDLRIDGAFVEWGAYAADHVYWLESPGTGAAVRFNIHDGRPNGEQPPPWYADNMGGLTVEIYEASDPAPDCVCRIVRLRVPSAVITDALLHPERYYGWDDPMDPNKPPSPANPPRACLSLEHINLDYHPLWNLPRWKVSCPSPPSAP